MSNIAVPSRTEPARTGELLSLARTLLAAILLAVLLITVTPFLVEYHGGASGNVLNQIVYSALAAVTLLGHLMFTERSVALSLLRPTWLILAAWLVLAGLQAQMPEAALRAVLFTLIAMIAATGVLCLPPNPRAFRAALAMAAIAAIGLSYFGVLAMPGTAIHSGADIESQHAGLWRGAYSHKNVAGAIMASLFFCGLYLLRSRMLLVGAGIMVLAAFFVVQTGSKTASALLVAVALLVMSARSIGGRRVPVLVIATAFVGMALLTLGSVIIPALDDLLQAILPGTTFTGRTDIWRFALDLMPGHQWKGFGFESFWRTGVVLLAEPGDTLAWDPRGIVNGHNSYLDVAIAIGWPGLAIAILVLLVLPLRDYLRAPRDAESSRLADLFLMMLTFILMNAFLESFFFERAHPTWMLLWVSVVGLRLLGRHRLDTVGSVEDA